MYTRKYNLIWTAVGLLAILLLAAPSTLNANTEKTTDADISAAVKTEILVDAVVSAEDITVSCEAGVVTLTGTVNNLTEQERAARIAATVRGVRSVVNRIAVEPLIVVSDEALQRAVKDALLSDPAADSYEVDVVADNGRITLSGTVDSWAERDLAGSVAGHVAGVESLNNQISVRFDAERRDLEVQNDIEERLKWDAHIDARSIDVSVEDGVATLTGTVGSAAERSRARREAWVLGVKDVNVDGLTVSDVLRSDWKRSYEPFMASDKDIESAVNAAILFDPRVNSLDVVADVDGGVVTLTGVVDNMKARTAAYEDAMNTVGVVRVENAIAIKTSMELADHEVERHSEAALARDPFIDEKAVTVDVTGGTATLTGTVDSYFEKGQAEDVISRVMGVVAVANNLSVQHSDNVYLYDPHVDDWRPNIQWYSYQKRNPQLSDAVIAEAIRTQLWWSPFVDSDEVSVSVDSGVATLTGTVSDWNERRAAENNAFDGGALWVRNHIEVAANQSTQ